MESQNSDKNIMSRPTSPVSSITSSQMDDEDEDFTAGAVSPPLSPHKQRRTINYNMQNFPTAGEFDSIAVPLNDSTDNDNDAPPPPLRKVSRPWTLKRNGILSEEGFNRGRSGTASTRKSMTGGVYEAMRKEMEVAEIKRLGSEKLELIDISLPQPDEVPFSLADCEQYNFKWALTPTVSHPRATTSLSTLSIIESRRIDSRPESWTTRERKLILSALRGSNLVPSMLLENRTRRPRDPLWGPMIIIDHESILLRGKAEHETLLRHLQRNIVDPLPELRGRLLGRIVRGYGRVTEAAEGAREHYLHPVLDGALHVYQHIPGTQYLPGGMSPPTVQISPVPFEAGGDHDNNHLNGGEIGGGTPGGLGSGAMTISRRASRRKKALVAQTHSLHKSNSDSNLLCKAKRGGISTDMIGPPMPQDAPPPQGNTRETTSDNKERDPLANKLTLKLLEHPPLSPKKFQPESSITDRAVGCQFLGISKADVFSLMSAKQFKTDETRRRNAACKEKLSAIEAFIANLQLTEPYMRTVYISLENDEEFIKKKIARGNFGGTTATASSSGSVSREDMESALELVQRRKKMVKEILTSTEHEFERLNAEFRVVFKEYDKAQKSLKNVQGKLGRLQTMWLTKSLVHAVGKKGNGHLQQKPAQQQQQQQPTPPAQAQAKQMQQARPCGRERSQSNAPTVASVGSVEEAVEKLFFTPRRE